VFEKPHFRKFVEPLSIGPNELYLTSEAWRKCRLKMKTAIKYADKPKQLVRTGNSLNKK
jgi:hypothetical protein